MSIIASICTTQIVSFQSEEDVNVLSVFKRCSAVKIGDVVLGSHTGRYQPSSLLMVRMLNTSNEPRLAAVDHFAKCTCVVKTVEGRKTHTLWFIALCFFPSHECKVWFGYPVEVWPTVASLDVHYVPLSHIKSRVAYSLASVNFGSVIGSDTVYIVVPV